MTTWPWLCKPEAARLDRVDTGISKGHVTVGDGGADEYGIPNVS